MIVSSLLLAAAMTAVVVRLGRSPGSHWSDPILWVGYLAGSLASGKLHSPTVAVAWLTIFLGLVVLSYVTGLLLQMVLRRLSKSPSVNR